MVIYQRVYILQNCGVRLLRISPAAKCIHSFIFLTPYTCIHGLQQHMLCYYYYLACVFVPSRVFPPRITVVTGRRKLYCFTIVCRSDRAKDVIYRNTINSSRTRRGVTRKTQTDAVCQILVNPTTTSYTCTRCGGNHVSFNEYFKTRLPQTDTSGENSPGQLIHALSK